MFRSIRIALFSLLLLSFLNSCQKELNGETGTDVTAGTQSGTGVFLLDGSPGTCTTALINGEYIVGTPLDSTNFVVITITVSTVGTYTISTGLINGIRFVGSGTFASTGSQTITLLGTGTPTAASTSPYIPGTNGCSFLITATTGPVVPPTVGSLDCSTASTAGVYTQSIGLTAANTVTIPVNVTIAGPYSITTTVTNGVTFTGSGNLALGAQNIVLTGSGMPTDSGAVSFPVRLGDSTCNFSITFLPAPPPATGTLNCATATLAGSYTQGLSLDASNTVTIPVNVTSAGLYNITATANGVTFSGSGTVAVGPQNIVLTGSGTGTSVGSFTYPISLGTSNCSFSVTFATAPTDYFRVKIDGVLTNFNANLLGDPGPLFSGYNTIAISGDASSTSTEHLDITINNINAITTGTYSQGFGLSFGTSRYFDPVSGQGYQPSSSNSNPPLAIVVTSITSNRIIGTFSAQYFDLNGTGTNTKQFTNGEFNVPY